jgi:phosphomevalonate kinase
MTIASAPGKLVLAGEYAVLEGNPAVVAAVGVWAHARVATALVAAPSPFLEAVSAVIDEEFGTDSAAAARARRIVVDSRDFFSDGRKLGLGSSASTTAAAVACALAADRDESLDRPRIFDLALRAHARAQRAAGHPGSGIDIAAAVWGGLLRFEGGGATSIQLPQGLLLVPFVTTGAAHTPALVRTVLDARAREPLLVGSALARIAAAATALVDAHTPATAVTSIDAGADALEELGGLAGVDLLTSTVRALRRDLAAHGAAAKTAGAGGGDVGFAVSANPGADHEIRAAIVRAGARVLDLAFAVPGISVSR